MKSSHVCHRISYVTIFCLPNLQEGFSFICVSACNIIRNIVFIDSHLLKRGLAKVTWLWIYVSWKRDELRCINKQCATGKFIICCINLYYFYFNAEIEYIFFPRFWSVVRRPRFVEEYFFTGIRIFIVDCIIVGIFQNVMCC